MEDIEKTSFNLTYSVTSGLAFKPNLISLSSVDIINQAISSGKDPFWFKIIPYDNPRHPPLEIGTAIFNRIAFLPRLANRAWAAINYNSRNSGRPTPVRTTTPPKNHAH